MKNRRNFLKRSIAGLGFVSFPFLSKKVSASEMKIVLQNSYIHHVYFWLKQPESKEACRRFEEGLQLLVTIPEIKLYHIGKAVESSRDVVDDSFTYSYMAVFNNKADQDNYQVHPTHLKFIENYGDLWENVIVYDAL
ncbi:Dabb family protein [Sunxiuqinia indica]|uniref:Dabb family protein n=1 Tax=Sunxiuqinia indica TaxID=2692584 RepID=UPI0013580129|nr:Dabb family protein [Sunxiuqinia indica]